MDIEGISTKLIKEIAVEISTPLAHIFNISLITGTFPNKLKESRTLPIFKAGNPEICDSTGQHTVKNTGEDGKHTTCKSP